MPRETREGPRGRRWRQPAAAGRDAARWPALRSPPGAGLGRRGLDLCLMSCCTPSPAHKPSERGRLSKALSLHFEERVHTDARRISSLLGPRGARHRVAPQVCGGTSPARPRPCTWGRPRAAARPPGKVRTSPRPRCEGCCRVDPALRRRDGARQKWNQLWRGLGCFHGGLFCASVFFLPLKIKLKIANTFQAFVGARQMR